jgi:hypothetical protein
MSLNYIKLQTLYPLIGKPQGHQKKNQKKNIPRRVREK